MPTDEELDENQIAEILTKLLKNGKRELGRGLSLLNRTINKNVVVKALRKEVKSLKTMHSNLEDQVAARGREVDSLTETLESTSESLSELRASFDENVKEAKAKAAEKVKKAKDKVSEQKDQLKKLQDDHDGLTTKVTEIEGRERKLLAEKDDLNKKVTETLERQVELEQELAAALTSTPVLEAQLEQSEARHSRLEEANKKLSREVRGLKMESDSVQKLTKAREEELLKLRSA